jgi:hypothetical protein
MKPPSHEMILAEVLPFSWCIFNVNARHEETPEELAGFVFLPENL